MHFGRSSRFWLYVIGGLFACAAILEVGLRVGLGLGTPPLVQADSTIGYVFQANQDTYRFTNRVHINAYHQRSEDLRQAPGSTFVRVLFLGDSVTWGGVLTDQEDTIPEEVERLLKKRCKRPVEALNASAGSWGIGNLRAYAERFGFFDSDAVVLQIGTHDLIQATSTSEVVGRNPSYPNENPTLALMELWQRYLWPRYIRPYVPDLGGSRGFLNQGASSTPDPDTRFSRNLDHLRALVTDIHKAGLPVVILHTPNRNEVVGKQEPPSSSRRQRFLQVADSMHVPVVNLAEQWAPRSDIRPLYRDHVHLNERGNAAVTEILGPALIRRTDSLCTTDSRRRAQ
ncbi:SGNH/GDSL hydrolase family protein [Salinibacter ruber]|uniref:SGNH/GDSL hydrolase family protein n=1 Tax=Salinibacter ruber TaxID=146919 RepID=UPI003C6E75D0